MTDSIPKSDSDLPEVDLNKKEPISNEEAYAFSADINQLLSLIINTFYSNKDIFVRELISNASDALDKIRYKSLTNPDILGDNKDLEITIIQDRENKKIIIQDTGIGMTKQELINNLGTIAKSGTKAFMEMLQSGQDVNMIGQFGVGFYSAFLVSDRVDVHSYGLDSESCYTWSSNAGGKFTISESDKLTSRGTLIELYLKEGMDNYLEEKLIRDLVRKHADFIDFTVKLWTERSVEEEVEIEDGDEEDLPDLDGPNDEESSNKESTESDSKDKEETVSSTDDDKENNQVEVEDVSDEEEKSEAKPKTKKVTKVIREWEPLNYQKPLWTRSPSDITDEEYGSFYKAMANDFEPHLAVKHFSVEGQIEFKSLLFVPRRAPFDLYDRAMRKMDNIKLYVKRVFIMDKIEDLLPSYLCFIRGIVDSEDLPLNISRETLQQNKIIRVMRKHLIKKCLDLLTEVSENKEDYKSLWNNFSKNIKLGIHEDHGNKDKLAKLLRYQSSHSKGEVISLDEYIENMPTKQQEIYYITGETIDSVKNSPFVEKIRNEGMDVLYMTDPIDEYCMQQLRNYEGRNLYCITKENFKLEQDKELENHWTNRENELKDLCEFITKQLSPDLEKTVVSKRLVNSPCALVTGQFGWTANMERLVKAQALQNNSTMVQSQMMAARKTLEINPDHPVVHKLESLLKTNSESLELTSSISLLFNTAMISSGFTLSEPTIYTNKINRLIAESLKVDTMDEWEKSTLLQFPEPPKESQEDNDSENKNEETDKQTDVEPMEEIDE